MDFDYSPIARAVEFSYKCPECGTINEEELTVPSPNYNGDTQEESQVEDYTEVICENCGREVDVTLITGMYGGICLIDDISNEDLLRHDDVYDDEDILTRDPDDDENAALSFKFRFDSDINEITTALDEIKDFTELIHGSFYAKLCYANVIACMEAYLADTYIANVVKDDTTLRKFTESYLDFTNQNFKLSDIYKRLDNHKSFVIKTLRDVIYHNMPKVKEMYKATFGVDLGNISDVAKAVNIRHDIVHRNGKDKEGNDHVFDKQSVKDLIAVIIPFVENIERQIEALNAKE